ncbi:MAG: putative cobaltochelatase [Methylococcales bacterium]
MKLVNFPFSAIVEQSQLKTALLLCAIDPSLGGVLIRGDKGTAKSTAARALADILPPIQRIIGCAFNCPPGAPSTHCKICNDSNAVTEVSCVPFINLPLGATEDRVIGTLDLQLAIKGDGRAFQPGLLAAAHRGILYIDEVNLLQDHLVDVLLDAAAMGVNSVQREGLSVSHPSRFTLIGTMNPEEGDLRPQLLDRFGLMVEVVAPQDKTLRTGVVRRRIAFEADSTEFAKQWSQQQRALSEQLITAQQLLSKVVLDDGLLELISHLCCEFEVASLRADIVMHKASRALAALDARKQVTADDVKKAAQLVLPHRRRRKPFEQPGLDQEHLDDLMGQANQPQDTADNQLKPEHPEQSDAGQSNSNSENDQATSEQQDAAQPEIFSATASEPVRAISVETDSALHTAGRRSTSINTARGQTLRTVANENPDNLAIGATLRSAVLRKPNQGQGEIQITKSDLHQQIRQSKHANLIVLLVDASGSMAAQRRMQAVKGAVLALLTDAYQRRDQVAVVSFRGVQAEILLAPTCSIDLAQQSLQELPTGGRTPLPHALQLTLDMLQKNTGSSSLQPLLVLLSDGKANVALNAGHDPWQETLAIAELFADDKIPVLVIDTETDYLRLGRAAQLAQALGGHCLTLEELSADNLALTIRCCMDGCNQMIKELS